jgi:hypothetical protein
MNKKTENQVMHEGAGVELPQTPAIHTLAPEIQQSVHISPH